MPNHGVEMSRPQPLSMATRLGCSPLWLQFDSFGRVAVTDP
jgi:hypothetical protein